MRTVGEEEGGEKKQFITDFLDELKAFEKAEGAGDAGTPVCVGSAPALLSLDPTPRAQPDPAAQPSGTPTLGLSTPAFGLVEVRSRCSWRARCPTSTSTMSSSTGSSPG